MTTSRILASDVLQRIYKDDAYSHIALSSALEKSTLDERDRALATELVYGTLARQRTIDTLLERFVNRRLDKLDLPVLISLRLATYQFLFLDRIPPHAAVNEAVEYVKARGGRGAAGFVNGVLRAMLRKKDRWPVWENFPAKDSQVVHLGVLHSLPDWIARQLINTYGFEKALALGASFLERPPLYFRPLDKAPDPLPEGLTPTEGVPDSYRAQSMTPQINEALKNNQLLIQDLGSQLVGHFAAPKKDAQILDACAGLGGKTLLLARLAGPKAKITAVDPQKSKLMLLDDRLENTPFADSIHLVTGEVKDLPDEATDFDLVLVDAPCSGLGVLRRHPETRWRRSPRDVHQLAKVQRQLLDETARRVRPGGNLVYSVCTFTNEEGPEQIEAFLKRHPDFKREAPPKDSPIDWSRFADKAGDLRLNPVDHDADAFYAARLIRS